MFWAHAWWLAIPTSIICGFMLPAAYIGFTIMQGKKSYLGKDFVKGKKGLAVVIAMASITLFLIVSYATKAPGQFESLLEKAGG